ncbi:MAG: hypothetical protein JW776_12140 [Candidatus Lokiarchaeota archaeon]|nr:hypothetical protein [Candidatus Lokiarchaeota archaeon]
MHTRKLNELEYMMWTLGQPSNISMAISIKGKIIPDDLRKALDKIQTKHPALRSQIYTDNQNLPFMFWPEIESIPLKIMNRESSTQLYRIVENEFTKEFEMGENCTKPLIRAILLQDDQFTDLILTLQHVIGDGMSMVFLFLDLFHFLSNPNRNPKILPLMKKLDEILPLHIQSKLPKTRFRFFCVYIGVKIIVGFRRFFSKLFSASREKPVIDIQNNQNQKLCTYSWVFNTDQTKLFLKNCKSHNIKLHSAICTAFLPDFPIINSPVNLRRKLKQKIGGDVGLFAGGVIFKTKYDFSISFWKNAERFQKNLYNRLESKQIFQIYKLFSRVVPKDLIQKLSPLFVELRSRNQPFVVTNLGNLDLFSQFHEGEKSQKYELHNFFGGVSGTFNALVLTVFTIRNQMHFHFHFYAPLHSEEEIKKYVKKAQEILSRAHVKLT